MHQATAARIENDLAQQRRSLERFSVSAPAIIEVIDNADNDCEFVNLVTRDVCGGGAYFYTEEPLPEGTCVKIDLILLTDPVKSVQDDQALVKLRGEVVRAEEDGMAICFTDTYNILPL